jgi:hypothetical protein
LKLKYDNLRLSFAFKFNLRRYIMARWGHDMDLKNTDGRAAGAYTRPLFGST